MSSQFFFGRRGKKFHHSRDHKTKYHQPLHTKMKLLLLENIHSDAARLWTASETCDCDEVQEEKKSFSGEELKSLIIGEATNNASAIGIRSVTKLTKEILDDDKCKSLRAIGCYSIGVDGVDLRAAALRGIPVFNSQFSSTRSVAELIMWAITGLARHLVDHTRQMRQNQWCKVAVDRREIRGQTLGIVGYGNIGNTVGILAESLGMKVLFYDIVPKLAYGNNQATASLADLLHYADFVTLHVPGGGLAPPFTLAVVSEKDKSKSEKVEKLGEKVEREHLSDWNKPFGKHIELNIVGTNVTKHFGEYLDVLDDLSDNSKSSEKVKVEERKVITKADKNWRPLFNSSIVGEFINVDDSISPTSTSSAPSIVAAGTNCLIGAAEIAMMKPGACLLNASRGNVVDVEAVVNALRSKHLAGYYADVFPYEPKSNGEWIPSVKSTDKPNNQSSEMKTAQEKTFDTLCELQQLDNVIITPHIGGSTEQAQKAIAIDVTTKLLDFFKTGSTIGAVNLPQLSMPVSKNSQGIKCERILNVHRNVPGVLKNIFACLKDFNIVQQNLSTLNDIGYCLIDVEVPTRADDASSSDSSVPTFHDDLLAAKKAIAALPSSLSQH